MKRTQLFFGLCALASFPCFYGCHNTTTTATSAQGADTPPPPPVRAVSSTPNNDVNGDGKADLIAVQPAPFRAVVWTSKVDSNGFEGGKPWGSEEDHDYSRYLLFSADVNGDGKADLIAVQPAPFRAVVWTSKVDNGLEGGKPWGSEDHDYSRYLFPRPDRLPAGFGTGGSLPSPTSLNGFDTNCIVFVQLCHNYHLSNGNKIYDGSWYPCGACIGLPF